MTRAHRGGSNAETTILNAMTTYLTDDVFYHKDWLKAGQPVNCVVRNVPYVNIYGSDRSRTEFMLVDPTGHRTRIEVKWQSRSGSVDEKYPFVIQNAKTQWPEPAIIIVTGGGGAKPKAIEWLKQAAIEVTEKSIVVMGTLDEFSSWAHARSLTWGS